MTLPCYYFKRSLLPVTCPPPCLLALASPPQSPSSHFLPLSKATQAVVPACTKWRRDAKGAVGWGQMHKGWDFLKHVGCQQKDPVSHSSRADLCLLLLLYPAEGSQPRSVQSAVCGPPPLLSRRVKTAGKMKRKKREFTSFCKLIGVTRTCYQPFLQSGPKASEASYFPTLTCLAKSLFASSGGMHWTQLFTVFWWETVISANFQPKGDLIPWIFSLLCACVSLIKRNYLDF